MFMNGLAIVVSQLGQVLKIHFQTLRCLIIIIAFHISEESQIHNRTGEVWLEACSKKTMEESPETMSFHAACSA